MEANLCAPFFLSQASIVNSLSFLILFRASKKYHIPILSAQSSSFFNGVVGYSPSLNVTTVEVPEFKG